MTVLVPSNVLGNTGKGFGSTSIIETGVGQTHIIENGPVAAHVIIDGFEGRDSSSISARSNALSYLGWINTGGPS